MKFDYETIVDVVNATPDVATIEADALRGFNKPMGLVGSLPAYQVLHVLDLRRQSMGTGLRGKAQFFSAVRRAESRGGRASRRARSVRAGAKHARGNAEPLAQCGRVASSFRATVLDARRGYDWRIRESLSDGQPFSVATVDAAVMSALDLVIDRGASRYANHEGSLSTIIDFANLRLLRRGVCCEAIFRALQQQFGVTQL